MEVRSVGCQICVFLLNPQSIQCCLLLIKLLWILTQPLVNIPILFKSHIKFSLCFLLFTLQMASGFSILNNEYPYLHIPFAFICCFQILTLQGCCKSYPSYLAFSQSCWKFTSFTLDLPVPFGNFKSYHILSFSSIGKCIFKQHGLNSKSMPDRM